MIDLLRDPMAARRAVPVKRPAVRAVAPPRALQRIGLAVLLAAGALLGPGGVRAADPGGDSEAKAGKTGKVEKVEKAEKAEKVEKVATAEKGEKAEKGERTTKAGKTDKAGKGDTTEGAGKTETAGRTEAAEKPARADKARGDRKRDVARAEALAEGGERHGDARAEARSASRAEPTADPRADEHRPKSRAANAMLEAIQSTNGTARNAAPPARRMAAPAAGGHDAPAAPAVATRAAPTRTPDPHARPAHAAAPVAHAVPVAAAAPAAHGGSPAAPGSSDYAQHCRRTSWDEIAALFDRWNASLQTHDPDQVVANYTRDAVLLPTVSNVPRTTPAEIRDYFEHFLDNSPSGRIDRRIIRIRCNSASDVGLYTFTLHGRDGSVKQVSARYSFVYEWRGNRWLIAHHHSSAMPEPAAAPAAAMATAHGTSAARAPAAAASSHGGH